MFINTETIIITTSLSTYIFTVSAWSGTISAGVVAPWGILASGVSILCSYRHHCNVFRYIAILNSFIKSHLDWRSDWSPTASTAFTLLLEQTPLKPEKVWSFLPQITIATNMIGFGQSWHWWHKPRWPLWWLPLTIKMATRMTTMLMTTMMTWVVPITPQSCLSPSLTSQLSAPSPFSRTCWWLERRSELLSSHD